jgi:hypothetical protein
MVAAAWARTVGWNHRESKQYTNFRHGEVPAEEAGFIRGMSASLSKLFRGRRGESPLWWGRRQNLAAMIPEVMR